jgi:EmrB/QacA subfamily drug resistance transporter
MASTLPPSRTYAALVTMLVLSGLDQTILSTALPSIARELGGGGRLSWVFSAYLIASTVVIPLHGKLADRWGTRPLLLAATALFALGSLACTTAGTMEALIAARALQGLGGGGLMTLTMLAVAGLFPPEERARRMGLLGAAYGLSTMLGPQIGAALVQALSWHWAFALNVPVALAAGAVMWRSALARPAHPGHALDVAGAALLAASLIALLLATRRDAGAPVQLGSAGLGAVLLAAWFVVERRAADPVVPLVMFRDAGFASAAAIGAASGIALFSAVVFLPLYLQTALHLSPSVSALHLLPMMLGITVAARLGGRALRAAVPARRLATAAALTIAAAFAALAGVCAFAPGSRWAISACLLPVGAGLGLLFPVVTVVSQRCAPPRHLGIATATPIMLRALGGALGVALLGELFSHRVAAALGAAGTALRGADPAAAGDRLVLPFAAGLEAVFACAAAAGLVAAFVAWRGVPRALPAAAGAPARMPPAARA